MKKEPHISDDHLKETVGSEVNVGVPFVEPPFVSSEKSETLQSFPKQSSLCLVYCILLIIIGFTAVGFFYVLEKIQYWQEQNESAFMRVQAWQRIANLHLLVEKAHIQEQFQTIQNLRSESHNNEGVIVLTESENLVEMASQLLYFQQNPLGAIKLLEKVDESLAQQHNMAFRDARAQLATVINQLKSLSLLDKEGLLLNLNQIMQAIPQFPLAHQAFDSVQPVDAQVLETMPAWKRGLIASWNQLKSLVLIQYHEDRISKARIPHSRAYLDGYLQSQVGMASWAVMTGKQKLYTVSVNRMIQWIKLNYAMTDPTVITALKTLNEISGISLNPQFPDLQPILKNIQELQAQEQKTVNTEQVPPTPTSATPTPTDNVVTQPHAQASQTSLLPDYLKSVLQTNSDIQP